MPNLHKKPQPLFSQSPRAICPICGTTSYSPAGVHPQCAMAASDEVLTRRIKECHSPSVTPKIMDLRPFERRCPRCQAIQHVRKRVCDCGYGLLVPGSISDNRTRK